MEDNPFELNPITSEISPAYKLNSELLNNIYTDIKVKATQPSFSDGYNAFALNNSTPSSFDVFKNDKINLKDYSINVSDVYKTLNSGEGVAMYESYLPGVDNNERLAQSQTTTDKWLNGIGKFVGKTANAVIGGTIGAVYGIGKMVEDGSLTAIYDNSFTNYLSDLDTKLNYQMPNRYTKQEQDKNLFSQLGTANFWSDKVLGGLSFTAGALISEGLWAYATGGTSLATTAARWGSKGLGFTKVAQGVNTYKGLLKQPLLQAFRTGEVSKNTAIALGRAGDLLNTTRFTLTSAGYEASVEALQYKKEARENFYNNFAELNGRQPSAEEITQFESNLVDSSNAVFGLNMAIVGSSNLVTMGKLFDLKNPIRTGIGDFIEAKAFGRGIEKLADGSSQVIKATRGQKIARNIFQYGKAPITEGLYEEGGQGTVSKTAQKWIEHSYNPQYASENIELAGLVYESLGEQYGTKEGWVENGVGMIIGALGGSVNTRAEIADTNARIEFRAQGLNTFTDKVIGERLLMANRISGFSQEAETESQNGNIVKSRIATDGVIHAKLNHAYQLGEDLNSVVQEGKVALDTMSVDQFKAAGIEEDAIDSFKENTIAEYQKAANQFKQNRKYAEYVIGRGRIAGAEDVFAQGEEVFKTNNQEALIQSLTWTLSAGENSANLMRDIQDQITNEIGGEQSRVMGVVAKLKAQQNNRRGQITKTTKQISALTTERDRLQKSIVEAQNAPRDTEKGRELGQLNIRLLDLNEQIDNLNTDLQNFADEMNSQQQYSQGLANINLSQDLITPDDLLSINENIKKFENSIEGLRTVNPQKHQYLTDLLDEYAQAEELFNVNQKTALMLSSGGVNIKNINNWLSKQLNKKASMDEVTKDWLIDVLQNYQKNKVVTLGSQEDEVISDEDYNSFVDENIVSEDILNSIAEKVRIQAPLSEREQAIFSARTTDINNIIRETPVVKPAPSQPLRQLSPIEQLKQRLENLLKRDFNSLSYIGSNYDDVYLQKPTKVEIEEYRSGEADEERMQFLSEKLGNWRLLDSAVDSENTSITDLIDLIEQLETQIEQENTKDEITPEEVSSIAAASKDGVSNTTVRYDLAQNTLGSITVQILKDKGIYKFSHLKMRTILDSLGIDTNSPRLQITSPQKNKLKNTEANIDNYSMGTVFHIDNTKIEIGAGNTILIKEEDFLSMQDSLNMHIVIPTINWSYFDVYETVDATARKKPSDFTEDINPQLIYEIQPEDELGFQIADDEYNKKLRDKVINGEIPEDLAAQLKIYITHKGQPISTLKGINTTVAPNENFLLLREAAKDAFIANPNSPRISGTIKARKVFLGSPQLTTEGLMPANQSLDESAIQQVISTGYIENGEFKLSRQVKDEIDKTYLSGIKNDGKKQPVILFKKGAYTIAYPVTLQKSSSPMAERIIGIVENDTLTEVEKVKAINEQIINTGIATDKRLASYDENQIQNIIEDFSANQTFVSMADFSSPNYRFQNLQNDILVNIDLNNLGQVISDPKLEIDLESIQLNMPRADRYDNMVEIEDRLSELAIELNRDYTQNAATKYVTSGGEILEDTVYTDVFDEGMVETNPTSHTQKIRNLNALQKAFSEPLPKIVKGVLTPQTIEEVEFLLKKYSLFKNQTTPNREEAEKAIKNNKC